MCFIVLMAEAVLLLSVLHFDTHFCINLILHQCLFASM